MSIFPDNQWYVAELAVTSRSKCKEFRCKQIINEGELRIGIKTEATDHSGDCLGWYHPKCLWKTFDYKSNGNTPIVSSNDIKNFRSLDESDREEIMKLINKRKTKDAAVAASPEPKTRAVELPPTPTFVKGIIALTRVSDEILCTGDTFSSKDVIKKAGAKWNGTCKAWTFTKSNEESVKQLFRLSELPSEGQTVQIPSVNISQTVSSTSSGNRVDPKFAMSGTIVFLLNGNSQSILISGDTAHIVHRLSAEGAYKAQNYVGDQWEFSTTSRAGARRFLCMPDDLPRSDCAIEMSLKELGEKQAVVAGETVSKQQQDAADEIYEEMRKEQDEKVVREAREALLAIHWGGNTGREDDEGGELGRGRRKRSRKNEDTTEKAKADVKPLPADIDDLCYESRLELSSFTVPDFKARLAARGLPVSGSRGELEARFLSAGADYAPIKDLPEYTRLAKQRKRQLKHVLVTRADELIDSLLARCVPEPYILK